MTTISVNTGRPYNILLAHGLIDKVGELIRPLTGGIRAAVVSDSNVAPIYARGVMRSLEENGFETSLFTFEAGEQSKRLSTVSDMYSHFISCGLTRTDIVVALGGGVTGDMAGFASASYLRGIDFVQIPTSLLAQVDSSVGGKTGVDLPEGKNLVGAFWQPRLVIIDPDTLKTLPERFFRDGLGEVVKYGCIRSRELFERLESENVRDIIDEVIEQCITIKRDVVEQDERDTGERAILNFGHTLGHAIEKLGGCSTLTHGEAVAAGAAILTRVTEAKGLTEKGSSKRLDSLLKRLLLPADSGFSMGEILKAAHADKKSTGKSIKFVFLKDIGECYLYPIKTSELEKFFE